MMREDQAIALLKSGDELTDEQRDELVELIEGFDARAEVRAEHRSLEIVQGERPIVRREVALDLADWLSRGRSDAEIDFEVEEFCRVRGYWPADIEAD